MSFILHIDTTTKLCSVALAKDGVLVSLKEEYDEQYSHAEKLNLFIDEVLHEAKITLQDLSAVAVSKGPGSYTGLRIGVSSAKGLCYGLNIPLISTETLLTLAYACREKIKQQIQGGDILIPMLDARRMEVYSQIFDTQLNTVRAIQAEIIAENSFAEYTQQQVFLFGDGALKCAETLNRENIHIIPDIHPSARFMVQFAQQKFAAKEFEDVAYFEPFYLKDFVAGPPKK
ncbi:MAG: tRNA (adenosine(37)-N6)-threonylcarbamoyltransferase complex dimerization subunit type 1 TsaB [Flavobacteriales bacterium]